jgi:hypothetical protein
MKTAAIALLVVSGLAGLLATACGGFFTVVSLMEMSGGRDMRGYATVFLVFSVPSLLVGALMAWSCLRKVRTMLAAPPSGPPEA